MSSTVCKRVVDAIGECVIGHHGRRAEFRIRIDIDGLEQFGMVVGEPCVFTIQKYIVISVRFARLHHQRIVLRTHVQIQLALRHIDDDSNVDVHESRLHHEKYGLATFERRRFLALVDGFCVEAHFRFDRQLFVALMAVDWIARVGITAFRTLHHPTLLR